jgi:hypothetical protein
MEDLVTRAPNITGKTHPSLGNLAESASSKKVIRTATHSSYVDRGAHEIYGRHPAHPVQRDAAGLCLPSVQDDPMADV